MKLQFAIMAHLMLMICAMSSIVSVAHTGPVPEAAIICDGCPLKNGVGFTNYSRCDQFVHCSETGRGEVVGTVQHCAFGTMWNQEMLTCVAAEKTDCDPKFDECYMKPDKTRRKGLNNCRGFWECRGGRSVPFCCLKGEFYDERLGCQPNVVSEPCESRCFNEIPLMTTMPPHFACDKRAIGNASDKYEQNIPGLNWVLRGCPKGLLYSEITCGCTVLDNSPQDPTMCPSDTFLSFDIDHRDVSGKNNFVQNENVMFNNGSAIFSGNSQLIIPRYTNIDVEAITVHVKYLSNHNILDKFQTVVSNSDCKISPSLMILEDNKGVTFTIGYVNNDMENDIKLGIPHKPNSAQHTKSVSLTFNNGKIVARYGDEEWSETVKGKLRRVHCALHVGSADGHNWFNGQMEELSVYLCEI